MDSLQATKKRRKAGRKDEAAAPKVPSGRQRVKKRRKIENLEGTTTPASNPKSENSASFGALVVVGILVLVCAAAAFWFFSM